MSDEPDSRPDTPPDDTTDPADSDPVMESEADTTVPASESELDASTPGTESESGRTDTREKAADEVYCSSCGEIIKRQAEICPECGVRQQGTPQQQKNPGLAAVASFFFAGLGQIYNGQIGKGLILILVQAVNVALMFVLVGLLTYPIVWIYGIWDAYKTAEKINSGEITV